MNYESKNYDHLIGTNGFSEKLLKNHFTLYQGYVQNANKMVTTLEEMLGQGKTGTLEYSELKRRLPFELNGIKLHELYFGNMTKNQRDGEYRGSDFYKKIEEDYGSFESWLKAFKGVGQIRGNGWAISYFDPHFDTVFTLWVDEHHFGHLAGAIPLLVMDAWEHAMMLDYGTKRPDYIEAFFKAVDWQVVAERYEKSSHLKDAAMIL